MISLAASLLTPNFIPSFWLDKDESAALLRTIYGQDLMRKGEPIQGNALALVVKINKISTNLGNVTSYCLCWACFMFLEIAVIHINT
jgi:hypothetical protein